MMSSAQVLSAFECHPMLQGLPGALSGRIYSFKRTIACTLSSSLSQSCATVFGAARYEIYNAWKKTSAQLSVQMIAEPAFCWLAADPAAGLLHCAV